MDGRLHYIDWLRVTAFAVLILYHCSVAFFPEFPWLIKSIETSSLLALVMEFPRAWRLALLFFISGMGTWFAFRSTPNLSFVKERAVRLGVPLLFAMCVIIVPQVWYERMYEDGFDGSLMSFWMLRYFSEGKYPTGNFTWAHMWFVAYLLVIVAISYPLMRLLIDPRMRRVMDWFEVAARSPAIYLFFLVPLVLNLVLSPIFPRATNALYNDGAWFASWASWFGLGLLFARHHRMIIQPLIARRWTSAWTTAVLATLLYRLCWTQGFDNPVGSFINMTPLYKLMTFALAWSMILTLLGFAALHANRKSAALAWLNHRIFPLYIVHQTVTVAALYHVLPLEIGLPAKLLLVVASTVAGSLAFCLAADQLPWPLRVLVGLTGDPTGVRDRATAGRRAA